MWIETSLCTSLLQAQYVTPCVGVWIETISFAPLDNFVGSHPAWVCGLKHVCLAYFGCQIGSHPAWVCGLKRRLIEIFTDKGESHPAWVCGLKLKKMSITPSRVLSHPAWVCGLKRALTGGDITKESVTPCVGVWIETCTCWILSSVRVSHPAWVCGLKPSSGTTGGGSLCHTLRGWVD